MSAKILDDDSDTNGGGGGGGGGASGAYDNERHYSAATAAAARAKTAGHGDASDGQSHDGDNNDPGDRQQHQHQHQSAHLKKKKSVAPPPPTKQSVPESASMPRLDDLTAMAVNAAAAANVAANAAHVVGVAVAVAGTPTQTTPTSATAAAPFPASSSSNVSSSSYSNAHDNSITSEPSEATTTCSDDVTVISQAVDAVIGELEEMVATITAKVDRTVEAVKAADQIQQCSLPRMETPSHEIKAVGRKDVGGALDAKLKADDDDETVEVVVAATAEPKAAAVAAAKIIPEIIEPKPEVNGARRSQAAGTTSSMAPSNGNGHGNEQTLRVDAAEVYQIIDTIRQTTNLSHRLSCVALQVSVLM